MSHVCDTSAIAPNRHKQLSWGTKKAEHRCQHRERQRMSEMCKKGKTFESCCHSRRLGLCAVYLSLFLNAMFLSVLTPCQPHLAGALWVLGRRLRWRYTKQPKWDWLGSALMEPALQTHTIVGPEAGACNLKPWPGILRGLSGSGASCQSIGTQSGRNKTCLSGKQRFEVGQKILTTSFFPLLLY